MPAPALASVDQLQRLLAQRPVASAAELAQALGISVPTVHRLLAKLPAEQLLSAGKARRARYALARPVRGLAATQPVYRVDPEGRMHSAGRMALLEGGGSWLPLTDLGWPVPDEARDGWWPGLAYPLHQMRPQGYMGRQFARAEHLRLGLPQDVRAWSDEDAWLAICQAGSDLSGDLIVGEPASELWLRERTQPQIPMSENATPAHYLQLAERAVASGVQGSSAAGEFPKFTAQRELAGAATPHVIVKFSGADDSATVQRWSDLLICEHLAAQHVQKLSGVQAARTRILQAGGRTFLEIERFDRHGDAGRSPLCALDVIDATFLGSASSDWTVVSARLAALGLINEETRQAVSRLWWFGRLIGNTDMHLGNLAWVPDGAGQFTLAPAYDMLPMRYAPLAGGEVRTPEPEVALPRPEQRSAWLQASSLAHAFWHEAAQDERLHASFRALCRMHQDQLTQRIQQA